MTNESDGDTSRSSLLRADWHYVTAPALDRFEATDWDMLARQRHDFAATQQVEHVLRLLRDSAADPSYGYMVNNFRHCLQSATAAMLDGRDEEYVVVALLHDIGFTACPTNHGAFAASLLAPYVSDAARWLLEHHQIFLAHHYHDHPDAEEDGAGRERWRNHPHFEATAEFVARFDQTTIVPGQPEAPLETFAPMLGRLLSRQPRRIAPRED